MMARPSSRLVTVAILCIFQSIVAPSTTAIGVNYGTKGDNLPPPATVAAFIANRTRIDRVKLFDMDSELIRAFAGTGLKLMVTAGNGDIPALATDDGAAAWVKANIAPYYPATEISLVSVGNEIMDTANQSLIGSLVPAMRTLKGALAAAGFRRIRVSTPHSLGILAVADPPLPPSASRFREGWDRLVFAPMLAFLQKTRSPFVVNTYPYFGYNGDTLPYALARPGNPGVRDPLTGITYTSMLEAQLDSVFSAMKKLGFEDVEITIGETGWPTKAMDGQIGVSPADAAEYNRYLIRETSDGSGTPLMPKRTFETYIFALFNENLKPGPIAERNFGMFQPDFTPMYDVGLMKEEVKTAAAPASLTAKNKVANANDSSTTPAPSPQNDAASHNAAAPTSASDGESSESTDKGGDAEGSTEKHSSAAASETTTNLVFHICSMLAVALSLIIHV